jgi:hypothetical protein
MLAAFELRLLAALDCVQAADLAVTATAQQRAAAGG